MQHKGKVQLPLQTASLVLGFMVWVILSSLMPFIKEDIALHLPSLHGQQQFPY